MRALMQWLDRNILELGREMRLSYLPPLMVYMAAGISGLTGIVGTFFVKDYLSLSAEFLAALGFWAGVPWALKMPLGHLVDLIWRWKSLLVFLGATMIASSLLIMLGLLTDRDAMSAMLQPGAWYVASVLLGAIGGPQWGPAAPVRPETALLRLRAALGVYANARAVFLHCT